MNVLKAKNKQGFTIIEVVLVLAIAALIFLMVFIALPALQRNQRDTAVKQESGNVLAALTTFGSNNRGNVITNSAADARSFARYVDGTATGPPATATWPVLAANGQYTIEQPITVTGVNAPVFNTLLTGAGSNPFRTIRIYVGGQCDPTNSAQHIPRARSYAVFTNLENGASATDGNPFCTS